MSGANGAKLIRFGSEGQANENGNVGQPEEWSNPNVEPEADTSNGAWDAYVLGHPQGSFFHLSGWRHVLDRTFSYQSVSCLVRRDGRVVGVLPLFLVPNLPVGQSLVSVPFGVYGGVCADDPKTGSTLLEYAKDLARRRGVRYLELRHTEPVGGLLVKDLYVTFRRDIHCDPEKNMALIPRKQRRMIRQGEKHGLTWRVGGEELLADFYGIYAESVRNLGTPVFPMALFSNLLEEFGSACRIFGVFQGSAMVAGVMTFFFRDQVMPYYGGARRAALGYAVNDFMYWNLLCYAAESGYSVFDFGRSKKDSGSYDFKRHWGFEPIPLSYEYYLVRQTHMPDISPRNPRFSPAIGLWKQLPLGVTRWLGPKLIRFFP